MGTILVVEDNELIMRSIELSLIREGYEVVTATNGAEACEWLDITRFDLVITDILMPISDGMAVLKHIKKDAAKSNVGIIVISSTSRERAILEAFDLGADDYISKPVLPAELAVRVRKVLGTKAVEQELSEHGDS